MRFSSVGSADSCSFKLVISCQTEAMLTLKGPDDPPASNGRVASSRAAAAAAAPLLLQSDGVCSASSVCVSLSLVRLVPSHSFTPSLAGSLFSSPAPSR